MLPAKRMLSGGKRVVDLPSGFRLYHGTVFPYKGIPKGGELGVYFSDDFETAAWYITEEWYANVWSSESLEGIKLDPRVLVLESKKVTLPYLVTEKDYVSWLGPHGSSWLEESVAEVSMSFCIEKKDGWVTTDKREFIKRPTAYEIIFCKPSRFLKLVETVRP